MYGYKKDHDRAIADFNQAIRLNPNFANHYAGRGLSYLYKKDYNRAITDLNQAIKLDPANSGYKLILESARKVRGY